MKIRYIKYWGAIVGATLFFSACKKDYLDIRPTDRIATTALQSDSAVFEAYVTNRYIGTQLTNKEGDGTPPGFGRGFEYAMWSSLTDESIYNNDDDTWLIQRGQLSSDNLGIANVFWGRSYRGIRECNFALSLLPNVPMGVPRRTRLEGELKFVRAFRYFDLIRNYGGVVLMGDRVTQLNENFQDPALFKRATIKESIDYVTAQLDDAIAKLPLANDDKVWIEGRATKGAALALKSRLLLYAASPLYAAGTWEAAVNAAQAVIGLNKYSLYTGGYANMFTVNSTTETIFARYYTRDAGHVHLEIANGPNGYGGWAGNSPLQNLVDDYEMSNGKAITDPTSGYNANQPYANRDPRFAATILYNGAQYRDRQIETFIPKGKDSRDGSENWNTSKTGYYLRKFINDQYPIQNPWGNAGFQTWTYFRLTEILLNFAEAANEAYGPDVVPPGATYSARTAVNAIRARAGVNMPALANVSSKDQMREAIRHERRIELAFEEHRFYDVRRWRIADVTENKPAMGVTITKTETGFTFTPKVALDGRAFVSRNYWLPIPRTEIQASNNQLQQNTGY